MVLHMGVVKAPVCNLSGVAKKATLPAQGCPLPPDEPMHLVGSGVG
jgi:hypothetical protein